jgi:predicted RNA-binding protein (TIGR00451 family)
LDDAFRQIRNVADYQFGKGIGAKLFPDNVKILFSRRTGRIRYVYLNGKRLATLRPMDGLFSLGLAGAKRINETVTSAKCFVAIQNDVSEFVADGGDVFAVHVVKANDEIRPKDEAIIVDGNRKVLAVGRAVLSSGEMKVFKIGVAVKVRRGYKEES